MTGIDFSATSVRHTEALKRKYDLDNLEVHQLPIERVGELGATFDQIVCTGVLHHLADPAAGLAALRDVLRPDGAMHLMVYAPYGRTGIYMLQEFCRRIGIEATDDGIRDLVAALGALPPGHPLATLLREAPDFRQRGGARRCAAAPAGPRLFGAAALRFPRGGGADVRPLGQAGALQPALRRHGAHPAGARASRSFRRRSSTPPSSCFAARCFATA